MRRSEYYVCIRKPSWDELSASEHDAILKSLAGMEYSVRKWGESMIFRIISDDPDASDRFYEFCRQAKLHCGASAIERISKRSESND